MAVSLNHTIVHCRDQGRSTAFVTEILGLPPPQRFSHFLVVTLANDVSLDYLQTDEHFEIQHYAFLISEAEFDEVWARVRSRGLTFWADPARSHPGSINRHDGGRGFYFEDPDGHLLEVLTRPYGGG